MFVTSHVDAGLLPPPGEAARILILPMQPTPNGPLHLGHIAGPYLHADVVARTLRGDGYDVSVICGSDVYENWILPVAHGLRQDPAAFCRATSADIRRDLSDMQIDVEGWIDPLGDVDGGLYADMHARVFEQLRGCGHARACVEEVPYGSASGEPAVGYWLVGRCPACGQEAGGNCCENCGFHYQPRELVAPRRRGSDESLSWRPETHWFMRPATTDALGLGIEVDRSLPGVPETVDGWLASSGGRIRLTSPGTWGVSYGEEDVEAVLANTFYCFCVCCGELYATARNIPNPLVDKKSPVHVIAFAGIDNLIPAVVAPAIYALHPESFRPPDQVVINRFLTLGSEKFSTSRRHGVWVGDVASSGVVHPDEIRLFLSSMTPVVVETDFSPEGLVVFVNDHRDLLLTFIARSASSGGSERPHDRARGGGRSDGLTPSSICLAYFDWLRTEAGSSGGRGTAEEFRRRCGALMPVLSEQVCNILEDRVVGDPGTLLASLQRRLAIKDLAFVRYAR